MSSILDRGSTILPSAARPVFTRAAVCSGPVETAYRRAGRGDTIVALAAREWGAGCELFPTLARDFRVIVPELEDSPADTGRRAAFATWLTAFLDGLGLDSVTLLADERFGGAALGSAMIEPGRIGRLVVVLDADDSDEPPAAACGTLCGTATKLFVTWLGADRERTGNEVAAMLLGGRRPPG